MHSQQTSIPTDIDIARTVDRRSIESVGADLGLAASDLEPRGDEIAKLRWDAIHRELDQQPTGKTILVTAMTPTQRGAGKTVTTVGLGQAITKLGETGVVAIREPSMGPVFGIKGGAAGGGYSQVLPMEAINLHFTGDIHAVTSAHNLIAATIDAHRHHGSDLDIDPDSVVWPRALDINDRALRETVVGLGGSANGPPREDGFCITAASELMAVLCLATGVRDLRERIARIIVAYDTDGTPITVSDLDIVGSVASLLRDALRPNLVQTTEGTPAFVHGGPFANIATGTNSILADQLGVRLGEYLVTEAGFGADLGAEKFVDVVSRAGIEPDATVIVATVDALQKHGGFDRGESDPIAAIRAGFANLEHHIGVLQAMGLPVVVAINRFPDDSDAAITEILTQCRERNVPAAVSTVYTEGGDGGTDLARTVMNEIETADTNGCTRMYELDASIPEKIRAVATRVYGATDVEFTAKARADIERIESVGLEELPVCLSKTPSSLSDDPERIGVPEDWTLTVTELSPSAGAGFIVVLTGDVLTMPGLPADAAAAQIDIDDDASIHGLF